jgi:hypothetical protein
MSCGFKRRKTPSEGRSYGYLILLELNPGEKIIGYSLHHEGKGKRRIRV